MSTTVKFQIHLPVYFSRMILYLGSPEMCWRGCQSTSLQVYSASDSLSQSESDRLHYKNSSAQSIYIFQQTLLTRYETEHDVLYAIP